MPYEEGRLAPSLLRSGLKVNLTRVSLPFLLTLALMLTLILPVRAGERKPTKPSVKDKCPVCGMFVAKYPDFLAEIIYKDGTYAVFDGAKDMFKYFFNLRKYNPSRKVQDIDSIYVTDYYQLTWIDGFKATYVIGSDIYGPMGKEPIPFAKEGEALEFKKDHKGNSLLMFKEITPEIIRSLD